MDNENPTFNFFLADKEIPTQKGVILLISLTGSLDRNSANEFMKLLKELKARSFHWAVLSLRDIQKDVERPQFVAFANLQKMIREKPAELKICGLHPELRLTLEAAGLIRAKEVVNNLADALRTLKPRVP